MELPRLVYEDLLPTRDYLRDVALAMGSLQRGFLPAHPRDWQHGLEVNMRGPATQPFTVGGEEVRAVLDMVRGKLRLGEAAWRLDEYNGAEIFKNFKVWLAARGATAELEVPEFGGSAVCVRQQAKAWAEALWWFDKRLRITKARLAGGVTSPVLLYPHHFDLALSWFPRDDDKQFTLGWSSGDEIIREPYVYLTYYPETDLLKDKPLPPGAHWQSDGFSGAVLPYAALQAAAKPEELFQAFADLML